MTEPAATKAAGQSSRVRAASAWFARHESGDELTKREIDAWEHWTADPLNSTEYDQLARLRWTLGDLPRPPLPTSGQLRGTVIPRPPVAHARAIHGSCSDFSTVRRRWVAATLVTSLVATLVLRLLLIPGSFALDSGHAYTTTTGERRDFTLADGSVVTLADASSLTVTLSLARRTVVLDRGEARFRVQHDPWRPFTVFAGSGSITAVGTVFDVRRYLNRVLVSVSEGAVKVLPHANVPAEMSSDPDLAPAPLQGTALRVASGQAMAYDLEGDVTLADPADEALNMGWTRGSFVYRDRPLYEVIEDVQRYTPHRIVLDAEARDLLYTGTFVERDLDQWLRGLSKIFPVEVDRSRSNLIVIRSTAPPQLDAANDPQP